MILIVVYRNVCVLVFLCCRKVLHMALWRMSPSLRRQYHPMSVEVLLRMVHRRSVTPTLTTCSLKTNQQQSQLVLLPVVSVFLAGRDQQHSYDSILFAETWLHASVDWCYSIVNTFRTDFLSVFSRCIILRNLIPSDSGVISHIKHLRRLLSVSSSMLKIWCSHRQSSVVFRECMVIFQTVELLLSHCGWDKILLLKSTRPINFNSLCDLWLHV